MEKNGKYIRLTPNETQSFLKKEDVVILDVRTEVEYIYEGKLENSILLDYLKPRVFKREIQKLDKEKKYLIYCSVGRVSPLACQLMIELGFKNVYELVGGLKSWQKEFSKLLTVSKFGDEEIIQARKKTVARLSKIEGQVRGIKKMLIEGEYCGDILNQSLAIKSALNAANQEIMEMFYKSCIVSPEAKDDFFKYLKKLMR